MHEGARPLQKHQVGTLKLNGGLHQMDGKYYDNAEAQRAAYISKISTPPWPHADRCGSCHAMIKDRHLLGVLCVEG